MLGEWAVGRLEVGGWTVGLDFQSESPTHNGLQFLVYMQRALALLKNYGNSSVPLFEVGRHTLKVKICRF